MLLLTTFQNVVAAISDKHLRLEHLLIWKIYKQYSISALNYV